VPVTALENFRSYNTTSMSSGTNDVASLGTRLLTCAAFFHFSVAASISWSLASLTALLDVSARLELASGFSMRGLVISNFHSTLRLHTQYRLYQCGAHSACRQNLHRPVLEAEHNGGLRRRVLRSPRSRCHVTEVAIRSV
jgi:hypothetical protein